MKILETAVRQADVGVFRNPDQVAAAAYRQGWYDLAKAFSDRSEQPVSLWVRAKLAVRDGDLDRAAKALAGTAAGFDADTSWNAPLQLAFTRNVRKETRTEHGTVALSRGELVDGFEFFLRAGAYYWLDIAYLADRVLSVDELGSVITRLDSIPIACPIRIGDSNDKYAEGVSEQYGYGLHREDVKPRLRLLYARRLMREGRMDHPVVAFSGFRPQQEHVARYMQAAKAAAASEGTRKAFHLFTLAQITRKDGLSLLSYESAPDFHTYSGNYEGETPLDIVKQLDAPQPRVRPGADEYERENAESKWRSVQTQRSWWSSLERERLARFYDSVISRYSYRWMAANLASQAADLLRVDSRAFGQVLCHASQFVAAYTPKELRKYYQRYLHENKGPAWRGTLGWNCPAVQWPADAPIPAP